LPPIGAEAGLGSQGWRGGRWNFLGEVFVSNCGGTVPTSVYQFNHSAMPAEHSVGTAGEMEREGSALAKHEDITQVSFHAASLNSEPLEHSDIAIQVHNQLHCGHGIMANLDCHRVGGPVFFKPDRTCLGESLCHRLRGGR